MNYTEIAQRFYQENGRAMDWKDAKAAYLDSLSLPHHYEIIWQDGDYSDIAKIFAESVRLEERRKVKQVLREEFLLNTENYPKEYHKLFEEKFNRAMNELESLKSE